MNPFTRLLGLTIVMLSVILIVAVAAQSWLRNEARHARADAERAMAIRLAQAVSLHTKPLASWDELDFQIVGDVLGGDVARLPIPAQPAPHDGQQIIVDYAPPAASAPTYLLRGHFPLTASGSVLVNHRIAFQLLGVFLVAIFALVTWAIVLWLRQRNTTTAASIPFATMRAEMLGLEQLAKTTVAQNAELNEERTVRQRTEEDLRFNQQLLSQSFEEKIRLGRDLHDGLIQSLYAAGLTVETARRTLGTAPDKADKQLEQALGANNGTIREVRQFIGGLTEDSLRRSGHKQSTPAPLADPRAGRVVSIDLRLDEEAASALTLEQGREVIQIVREAVSNALRHGQATALTVRLLKSEQSVAILVQDNGHGFDTTTLRDGGHGLRNMQARAATLGADIRVESHLGAGTRLVLTLPIFETPTA